MSEFAIADVTPGKLNALVKNIMVQTGSKDPNEAVRLVNSGEWTLSKPKRNWHEKDGVIYLSVTSDGTTGPKWIKRLEKNGFRLDYAKKILGSSDFKPTKSMTSEIAVLKGTMFSDEDRVTSKIRAEADRRGWTKPNAEVACLIRENFSDKDLEEMGLWWIVAMHEPINDADDDPLLLLANRSDDGPWLRAHYGRPDRQWDRDGGFAFVVSQVSA